VVTRVCITDDDDDAVLMCRAADAEGDGADEPESESGRADGVHAVGDPGRVWSCRCRGRQRSVGNALLTDVQRGPAGQLRFPGLHVQHEPVGPGPVRPGRLRRMTRTLSSFCLLL